MAEETKDIKQEVKKATYRYSSHTVCHFTHDNKEFNLQYGEVYNDLPEDSKLVQNLIDQKRLIKI